MNNFNDNADTNPAGKKTEEQVREEIRGNLMICCDSWSIENLATLEQCASTLGQIGMALHGQEFVGFRKIDQLMFDANGQFKLSDNPDSENSFFKVLATCIQEQKDILAQEKQAMSSIFEPWSSSPPQSGNEGNVALDQLKRQHGPIAPEKKNGYEFF